MSDPSRKTSFRGYWPGLAVMVSLCAALMFLMIYGGRDKAKINVDLTQSGVKIGGGITLEDRDYYALIGDRKVFIKSWLNNQQLNVLDIVAGDRTAALLTVKYSGVRPLSLLDPQSIRFAWYVLIQNRGGKVYFVELDERPCQMEWVVPDKLLVTAYSGTQTLYDKRCKQLNDRLE